MAGFDANSYLDSTDDEAEGIESPAYNVGQDTSKFDPTSYLDAPDDKETVIQSPIVRDKPEEMGDLAHAAGNIVEAGAGLAGGFTSMIESVGNVLEEKVAGLGGITYGDDGIEYKSAEEWRKVKEDSENEVSILKNFSDKLNAVDLVEPEDTWEDVKNAEGVVNTVKQAVLFAGEEFAPSLAHMAAMATNLPAYIWARAGDLSAERAKSQGRETPDAEDISSGLAAATVSGLIDRFGGFDTILRLSKGKKGFWSSAFKGGAVEAGTEAIQEIVEYIGTNYGTEAGATIAEGLDRAAAGAVGGGPPGAALAAGRSLISGEDVKPPADTESGITGASVDKPQQPAGESTVEDLDAEFKMHGDEAMRQGSMSNAEVNLVKNAIKTLDNENATPEQKEVATTELKRLRRNVEERTKKEEIEQARGFFDTQRGIDRAERFGVDQPSDAGPTQAGESQFELDQQLKAAATTLDVAQERLSKPIEVEEIYDTEDFGPSRKEYVDGKIQELKSNIPPTSEAADNLRNEIDNLGAVVEDEESTNEEKRSAYKAIQTIAKKNNAALKKLQDKTGITGQEPEIKPAPEAEPEPVIEKAEEKPKKVEKEKPAEPVAVKKEHPVDELRRLVESTKDPETKAILQKQLDSKRTGLTPRQQQMKEKKSVNPEKDDMLTAIKKLGGLDVRTETAGNGSDFEGRLVTADTKAVGLPGLEQKKGGGLSLADLSEKLHDLGYLNERDEQELYNKLDQASRGEEILSVNADIDYEKIADDFYAKQQEDYVEPAATLEEIEALTKEEREAEAVEENEKKKAAADLEKPAGEVDLLGEDVSKAQAVEDAKRAADEKRSPDGEQPALVQSGDDLFADQGRLEPDLFDEGIDAAAHEAATSPENNLPEPTEAQKEAGNYKKGRVSVNGLPIAVENPAGSIRSGTDAGGKKWSIKLKDHYGDFKQTIGAEGETGEGVDVFINSDATDAEVESRNVFVVDQYNEDGTFDEHKVVLGAKNSSHAKGIYNRNYEKDWEGGKKVTKFDWDEFKEWADDTDKTKIPAFSSSIKDDAPGGVLGIKHRNIVVDGHVLSVNVSEALSSKAYEKIYGAPGGILSYTVDGSKGFKSVAGVTYEGKLTKNKLLKKMQEAAEYAYNEDPENLTGIAPPKKTRAKKKVKKKAPLGSKARKEQKAKKSIKERAEIKKTENTVFTDEAAASALAIIKSKIGQVNAGIDPELFKAGLTLAGHTVESGARNFAAYSKAMIELVGESVRPYLKQWYNAVRDEPDFNNEGMTDYAKIDAIIKAEVKTNVQSEPESKAGFVEDGKEPDVKAVSVTDTRGIDEDTGQAVEPAGEEGVQGQGDIGLPISSTTLAGERGNLELFGTATELSPDSGPTGTDNSRRGTDSRPERTSVERDGGQRAEELAQAPDEITRTKPSSVEYKAADLSNVEDSLPQLFPEQQEDVVFAEERIDVNNAHGVIFTNGTGTGKTFTGLGVIKRQVMQGKENIIVTVPGEKILRDWIKTAKNDFGMNITQLKNRKDAGNGIVITTYANFGGNKAIMKRDWDLVVHDEVHYLSSDGKGRATSYLKASRAITGHKNGAQRYIEGMESELIEEIKTLKDTIKEDTEKNKGKTSPSIEKMETRLKEKNALLAAKSEEHRANRERLWQANTVKRVDLSATPFSYVESIDHAEGFLFDYPVDSTSGAYNTPSGRGEFFIEHFGYRMRTGKLTKPEAGVDSSLMERQFNSWLKEQGALKGRRLTVDHDYSREFITTKNKLGQEIDNAVEWLSEKSRDDNNPYAVVHEHISKMIKARMKYHEKIKLLESIKAGDAVDRAKKHLALGRKVVIFHGRIQGGITNPFKLVPAENDEIYNAALEEFNAANKTIVETDFNLTRPLDLFEKEFGDNMRQYNGTISKKAKNENPDSFNQEGGDVNVLVLQEDAGKEGISLHDTTGKNQRVLINIGLPVKPTQSIQIEGRTYRVGQMSNAIFEYFTTGTNFERWTFAGTIAERSGTAENLSLGEEARALTNSFIDAFEYPNESDPSVDQGTGGKEVDQSNEGAISEFDKAKTFYFGTQKTRGRRDQRQGVDYFATPEPLGLKMVEWADMKPNDAALEPSAGHGAIARFFPERVAGTFIEPSSELLSRLALRTTGRHLTENFEDLAIGNKYHAIVMNPPFGSGGSTAMDHLGKAMSHLKNGGRIVALIPEGPAADKKFDALMYGKEGELEAVKNKIKKKRKAGDSFTDETHRVDQLENYHLVAEIGLPRVAFERAGTAVKSRIVIIDRSDTGTPPQQISRRDISAENINEFFDAIEESSVPDRAEVQKSPIEIIESFGLKLVDSGGSWDLTGKTFENSDLIAPIMKKLGGGWIRYSKTWYAMQDPTNTLAEALTTGEVPTSIEPKPDTSAAAALFDKGRASMLPDVPKDTAVSRAGLVVTKKETNKGNEVWEVTGNTREHKDLIKSLGGRWYGPSKSWSFYKADPTAKLEAGLDVPALSRAGQKKSGSTKAQIEKKLSKPISKLGKWVKVEVVQSASELPINAPQNAQGLFYKGTVYIVADNVTQADVNTVLAHETVGHLGLERLLGKDAFNELVKQIQSMKKAGNKRIAKIITQLKKEYVDENGNYNLDEREESREILAYLAEKHSGLMIVRRIKAKIKKWLARHNLGNIDDAAVYDLIVRAAELVRSDYSGFSDVVGEKPALSAAAVETNPFIESARGKIGAKDNWGSLYDEIVSSPVEYIKNHASQWWKNIQQGVFDKFAGIKYALEAAGIDLSDYANGYVAARLSTSITDRMAVLLKHAQMEMVDGVLQPIEGTKGFLEILEPVSDKLEEFGMYLVGRRAEDLEATSRLTGFTPEEIQAMKDLVNIHPEFEQVAKEYAEINKSVLDIAEKAGLIDPETRPMWENANYVPFYRIMDEGSVHPKGSGKGITGQSSGIQRLVGSERSIGDPLENIMMNWSHLIDASVKNNAAVRVVDQLADSGMMEKAKHTFKQRLIGAEGARKNTEQLLVDAGMHPDIAEMMSSAPTLNGMTKLWSIEAPSGKDVVRVMRNGKAEYYHVYDENLFRSMTSFNDQKWGKMMGILRNPKRWLTRMVTADPSFMARNFLRDTLSAWVLSRDKYIPGIDSVKGIAKAYSEDPIMVKYMAAGGTFSTGGYVNANDPGEMSRFIASETKGLSDGTKAFEGSVIDSVKKAGRFWNHVGTSIENANRVAVALAAEGEGKTIEAAAYEMKDVMDFSMRGSYPIIQFLAETVPFFSARLQGMQRLGRGAMENPKAFTAKGSMITAASIALYMWNKDDDRFKELEEWDRDMYFHFFVGEEHFRLPKPFEVGFLFGTMPERLVEGMVDEDKDAGYVFDRMAWNLSETLNLNPIPQTFRPIIEQFANRSFFTDRPIVGMRLERLAAEAQYEPWTSETMRAFGEFAGVSPKRAESIVRGYFGTIGMYVLSVVDVVTQSLGDYSEGPERRIEDYPVIKSFFRGSGEAKNTRFVTEFYDMVSEVNKVQAAVKEYRRQGETDKASKLRQENLEKLRTRKGLNRRRKAISGINKQMRRVHYSKTMTPKIKRDKLERLIKRRNSIAQSTVERYSERF